MKKHFKLLLAILTVALCVAAIGLCACTITPETPEDTDKSKLTVTYDNSHTVYEGDALESIKPYLTVTYTDKEGATTDVTDYTLSGTLAKGESTLTVKYGNLTFTVSVTVTEKEQPLPPTAYTVTFKADNEIVGTQSYTAENKNITVPEVPAKAGYAGAWEQYTLTTGDVTVNAVYTVVTYTVTFKADGTTVATESYTVENKSITEPTVPEKAGYTAAWESYTLTTGDATVNAVYSPITYTITYKADGTTVGTQSYTVENKTIAEPAVPSKTGYTGVWNSYTVTTGDITVNAVYYANKYTVTFDYDGATGGNATETVKATFDKAIGTLPTPEKDGYVFAGWYLDDTEINAETVWTFDGNKTLTAKWNAASDGTQGLSMSLNEDNESYTVTGMGTATDADLVIPSTYKGKPVTKIKMMAFYDNAKITSVTISENIKSIEQNAFAHCENIKTVYWNATECTSCTNSIFYNCIRLTDAVIKDGVTTIPHNAFDSCRALENITIPNSVTYVGNAFSGCNDLKYTRYGNAHYLGNTSNPYLVLAKAESTDITEFTIHADTKVVSAGAFNSHIKLRSIIVEEANTKFASENGILYNKEKTKIIHAPSAMTVFKLADSLKEIAPGTFSSHNSLTEITIPDGITSIGTKAFIYCSKLTSVTIGKGVTSIGESAFGGCPKLTTIKFTGTVEQWNNITLDENWISKTGLATKVICSDGEVEL